MSRRDYYQDYYRPRPKKPPPADGIRMRKAGETWWGKRWIDALERMSSGYANRLQRGRTYARQGRTSGLEIRTGEVTARVTGSRPKPYKVTIRLGTLSDAVWQQALAVMADRAQFSAELLSGHMPANIDEAFRAAGASVFPEREHDLVTSCSCPDWANPCKHVAATHYVLGEALDNDPFLLLELRGRTQAQILAELRAARGTKAQVGAGTSSSTKRAAKRAAKARSATGPGGSSAAPDAAAAAKAKTNAKPDIVPSVTLSRISTKAYGSWREPPPELHLSLEQPPAAGALLRQLGAPPSWSLPAPPADVLAPLVRAASTHALDIALAGAEEADAGAEERPAHRRARPRKTP